MRALGTALVLALTTTLLAQDAPTFDLLLRGGSVVDGTRRPGVVADVAVRGGRIVALGDLRDATATRTVDCAGLVVAPGFVDVHAHADSEVARNPQCGNFLQMGVTTIVTGNCGSSVRDLAAHFARIEAGGVGVNYGSLVGLGTVRTAVMGTEKRDPTAEELVRMEQLVDEGMRHGAYGVSTGLIYVPGTYASTAEITALAKVAARHGGLYASHMRNENNDVLAAVAEALQVGRDAGIHVQVSHVKNTGRPNWGRSREVLDALRAARRSGQSVTADQYAYDASSTSLDVLFPSAELAIGRKEFAARLRDDANFRAAMKQALHATMDRVGFGDLRYARIASAPGNSSLAGLTIAEAAAKVKGSDDRDAQAEMAMDLFAASAGERVGMVYHVMSEEDVATFLAEDWIAIASDAGLRLPSADKPHPRGSGNNPRVLGRYVRERGVLDLPLAVHKMSRLPAQVFGIAERGEVRVGWHADLVVFDPATVLDQATYQDPLLPPVGIPYVIVNGTVAVDQGTLAPGRAGRVLRRNG